MKKTVYLYDQSGAFAGEYVAQESPLEPGVFITPVASVDMAPPPIDDGLQAMWNGHEWRLQPVVVDEPVAAPPAPTPTPTEEQVLETLTNAVQCHLDALARQYRYDNIHTACGWAGEFDDATALKTWAAECWRVAGAIEAAVNDGVRLAPTVDAMIAELPGLVIS